MNAILENILGTIIKNNPGAKNVKESLDKKVDTIAAKVTEIASENKQASEQIASIRPSLEGMNESLRVLSSDVSAVQQTMLDGGLWKAIKKIADMPDVGSSKIASESKFSFNNVMKFFSNPVALLKNQTDIIKNFSVFPQFVKDFKAYLTYNKEKDNDARTDAQEKDKESKKLSKLSRLHRIFSKGRGKRGGGLAGLLSFVGGAMLGVILGGVKSLVGAWLPSLGKFLTGSAILSTIGAGITGIITAAIPILTGGIIAAVAAYLLNKELDKSNKMIKESGLINAKTTKAAIAAIQTSPHYTQEQKKEAVAIELKKDEANRQEISNMDSRTNILESPIKTIQTVLDDGMQSYRATRWARKVFSGVANEREREEQSVAEKRDEVRMQKHRLDIDAGLISPDSPLPPMQSKKYRQYMIDNVFDKNLGKGIEGMTQERLENVSQDPRSSKLLYKDGSPLSKSAKLSFPSNMSASEGSLQLLKVFTDVTNIREGMQSKSSGTTVIGSGNTTINRSESNTQSYIAPKAYDNSERSFRRQMLRNGTEVLNPAQ